MSLEGRIRCRCGRWARARGCTHDDGVLDYVRITQWGWEALVQVLAGSGEHLRALRTLLPRTNDGPPSSPGDAALALEDIGRFRELDLGTATFAFSHQGRPIAARGGVAEGGIDAYLLHRDGHFEPFGAWKAPYSLGIAALSPVLLMGRQTGQALFLDGTDVVLWQARSTDHPLWQTHFGRRPVPADDLFAGPGDELFRSSAFHLTHAVDRAAPLDDPFVSLLRDQESGDIAVTALLVTDALHSRAETPPGRPSLGDVVVREGSRARFDYEFALNPLEHLLLTAVTEDRPIEWF